MLFVLRYERNLDSHIEVEGVQHAFETFLTEPVDIPAHQVRYVGLGHTQNLCRLGLRQVSATDLLREGDSKIDARAQLRCVGKIEPLEEVVTDWLADPGVPLCTFSLCHNASGSPPGQPPGKAICLLRRLPSHNSDIHPAT
jgi:hypothetical protein